MKLSGRQAITAVATAVALLAYALLTHYLAGLEQANSWAVVLAVMPASLLLLSLSIKALTGPLRLLPPLLLALSLGLLWPLLQQHLVWIYFIQHILLFSSMGLWFALSLRASRQPLCTHFASLLHEQMTPLLLSYTRQITLAWSLFFLALVLTSGALFALAPVAVWSLFANILSLPLVVLMFIAEYLVRRRVLPPEDLLGVTSAFRAYSAAVKLKKQGGGTATP